MIVAIHQPEYLIWLGLIDKIAQADIFVILDNVQFEKNNFQNRNKIRTKDGWAWLTIPLKKHPFLTLIQDIEIASDNNWQKKQLNLIKSNYHQAPFFQLYYSRLENIILEDHGSLAALNMELMKFVLEEFGITTSIVRSSEFNLPKDDFKINANLTICKFLNADTYLSGSGGKSYLDSSKFVTANIKVKFQEFQHPIYSQQFEPFIPCMSSIDLLFNYGSKAKEILFINNHEIK